MENIFTDEYFMKKALQEAEVAFEKGEIPVGAVIVIDNRVIASSHNLTEMLHDVTAHAEMQSITAAANFLGGKYLKDCTLYVTLEPCQMCAGALYWSQITKIVYGDECRGSVNNRFEYRAKYNQPLPAGEYLLHARVLDGNSVNQFLTID